MACSSVVKRLTVNQDVVGSIPTLPVILGGLVQLAEHPAHNRGVIGSSLITTTRGLVYSLTEYASGYKRNAQQKPIN